MHQDYWSLDGLCNLVVDDTFHGTNHTRVSFITDTLCIGYERPSRLLFVREAQYIFSIAFDNNT